MKRNVNKLENSQVEIIFTFEGQEWEDAMKKAFNKLAKELELPGFRKGHVPESMAKKSINQAEVMNAAIDFVIQPAFKTALEEEDIIPFARPSLEITKISEHEMEAKVTIIDSPDVELGAYKGLHVDKKEVSVSQEEIDEEVNKLLKDNAELVVTEENAKIGDTVVIDFTGYIDGEAFEGGSAQNYSLELGSGSFIPGFEDQLVGAKAGEEKDINVKFPENYVPELKGKDATFHVVIHEVKAKITAELDDEFVKELGYEGVETVEQLREKLHKDLFTKKDNDAKNEYYEELIKLIRENSKISLHPQIIHDEVEAMKENFAKQVQQNGLTLEQYYQISGQTPEDVEERMKAEAEINIRSVLVLQKICDVENLYVTDEEVEFEFAKIAQQYSMELDKVKEILKPQLESFKNSIQNRKINDFLLANND